MINNVTKFRKSICVACLCTVFSISSIFAQGEVNNLLDINGGWKSWPKEKAQINVEGAELTVSKKDDSAKVSISKVVKVREEDVVTLSGEIMTENTDDSVSIGFQCFNGKWKQVKYFSIYQKNAQGDAWKSFKQTVTVPADVYNGCFVIVLTGKGAVKARNLEVVKTP